MAAKHDLLRRHAAAEKTRLRYDRKPLDFGKFDCIRMLRSHLMAMGHRGLPHLPPYRSILGARRALTAAGFDTIEGLVDSVLPRIEPAEMLLGDVAVLRGGEDPDERGTFDSVTICVGQKVMGWGWVGDRWQFVMMTPHEYIGAWRA
jgi:hypothetical protein